MLPAIGAVAGPAIAGALATAAGVAGQAARKKGRPQKLAFGELGGRIGPPNRSSAGRRVGGHVQHETLGTTTIGIPMSTVLALQILDNREVCSLQVRRQALAALDNPTGAYRKLNYTYDGSAAADQEMGVHLYELFCYPSQTTGWQNWVLTRPGGTSNWRFVGNGSSTQDASGTNVNYGVISRNQGSYLGQPLFCRHVKFDINIRGATSRPSKVGIAIVRFKEDEFIPSNTGHAGNDQVNTYWQAFMASKRHNPLQEQPKAYPSGKDSPVEWLHKWNVDINPDDSGNKDSSGLQKRLTIKYNPNIVCDYRRTGVGALSAAQFGDGDDYNTVTEVTQTRTYENFIGDRKRTFIMVWTTNYNDTSTFSVDTCPSYDYVLTEDYVYRPTTGA